MNQALAITLRLPDWVPAFLESRTDTPRPTAEARMRLVIELSRENVVRGTGGPFAAAVFERESGRLVAAGVNVVVPACCSAAHAEAMALMLAQQTLGTFDLGAADLPELELTSSSQPCIQCFGNTWWSGVRALCTGARAEDVEEATGFDEGPLPKNWVRHLEERQPPVQVTRDVLRDEARAVLRAYREQGGPIYNPGSDPGGVRPFTRRPGRPGSEGRDRAPAR